MDRQVISTRTRHIVNILYDSFFKDVDVRYWIESEWRTSSASPFEYRVPHDSSMEGVTEHIRILDIETDYFLDDDFMMSEGRAVTLSKIKSLYPIKEGCEGIAIALYIILHERGHWEDAKTHPENYQNSSNQSLDLDEYNEQPGEKAAEEYAKNNFESTWMILNNAFHGLLV